jgi:hypothetical protein
MISMAMADDENPDLVGNAAEQKVRGEPPQILSPEAGVEGGRVYTGRPRSTDRSKARRSTDLDPNRASS